MVGLYAKKFAALTNDEAIMALHYTGREYDQLLKEVTKLTDERRTLKETLVSRLTAVMANQDRAVSDTVLRTIRDTLA